jgi:hypothetical protein
MSEGEQGNKKAGTKRDDTEKLREGSQGISHVAQTQ